MHVYVKRLISLGFISLESTEKVTWFNAAEMLAFESVRIDGEPTRVFHLAVFDGAR